MISNQIKRLYQSVLLFSIAGFFIILSIANPVIINHTDFSIYNTGWNGCSAIGLRTYQSGSFQPTLTYNQTTLSPAQQSFINYKLQPTNSSLFIIGPQTPFTIEEINYVDEFVSNGGILLLADDFGTANTLLSGLNTTSRFSNDLMLDLSFEKNASFVTIFNFHNLSHPLLKDITGLLLNYPSSLNLSEDATILASSTEMSWLDENQNGKKDANEKHGPFPVIAIEAYGNGTIVLFSDPSLLINSMDEYLSNQLFRSHLLDYLLLDKDQVIIDENHRQRMVPFHLGYQFITSIPSFLKISILLLAVILFLLLFTPIPQQIAKKLFRWIQPGEAKKPVPSPSALLEELKQKHPTWNQRKLKNLIERMKTNES
ncbi:MAG: DUF4350 domain-containing protein [Thermoplasmatota archaeon]